MKVEDIIKTVTEEISNMISTKTVIGEHIAIEGKTIIPVTKVSFGFGSGGAVLLAVARRTESPYLRVAGLFAELCAVALLAQAWFRFP